MRSATASRAVSIRIGTRSPAARSRRHTSSPSMSGMPTSSTTASGGSRGELRQRLLAVRGGVDLVAAQRQRAAQRVAQRAVVVDDQNLHVPIVVGAARSRRNSYMVLVFLGLSS